MMRRGYTGGHLGEYLEDYVDGALPQAQAEQAARHVVTCSTCRGDVDAEREILRRLRAVSVDPGRQADLMAGLLAFAPRDSALPEAMAHPGARTREAVALIAPSSPAQYSGRRRTPVVCAVAVALGCVGIITVMHVSPQRTAPADGRVVHLTSRQLLPDDVAAPQVQTAGYVPSESYGSGAVLGKHKTSGTIAP